MHTIIYSFIAMFTAFFAFSCSDSNMQSSPEECFSKLAQILYKQGNNDFLLNTSCEINWYDMERHRMYVFQEYTIFIAPKIITEKDRDIHIFRTGNPPSTDFFQFSLHYVPYPQGPYWEYPKNWTPNTGVTDSTFGFGTFQFNHNKKLSINRYSKYVADLNIGEQKRYILAGKVHNNRNFIRFSYFVNGKQYDGEAVYSSNDDNAQLIYLNINNLNMSSIYVFKPIEQQRQQCIAKGKFKWNPTKIQ